MEKMLPQMIGYVKYLNANKTMSFKINDIKLLKKYTQISKKVKNLLNIKLDSEPVYGDNDKYIKTKINIYDKNVNTNFHGKKIRKEKTACKCLSLILLDSFVKVKKESYPQTLLEECKYEIKKTKIESFTNGELEASSSDDDESDNESDDETGNKKDNEPSNEIDNESDNE